MIVDKVKHSGAITVTALVSDKWSSPWYETRTFYGYTKAESVQLFQEWCGESGKLIIEEVDA